MKFLVLLCVELLIVHVAWSAVAILEDSRNPDFPGKCYYNGTEPATILSPGETVTIKGECTRASCYDDFSMGFATCGTISGPQEYYIPANYSLPYSECCPTYGRPKFS